MKLTTNNGTYEQYDLNRLNDNDLEKFWRIIQDTWSYYFKEYMTCGSCETILSKKDMFRLKDASYRQYTIEELEKKYGVPNSCPCCDGELSHMWGDDYLPQLEKSLTQNIHTTLVVVKNKALEIVGLTYANVDPLKKIYQNDISYDFDEKSFQSTYLSEQFDETFMLTTGLSMIERETSKEKAYELLAFLHKVIPGEYTNLPGVLATIYRTPVYKLYQLLGAEDFNLESISQQNVRLMHSESMVQTFNTKLSFILD